MNAGFPEFSQWLQDKGFLVFLLSASPRESFPLASFRLNPRGAFGLDLKQSNGKYTGEYVAMTDERKRKVVRRLLSKGAFELGVGDRLEDMGVYEGATTRVVISDKIAETSSGTIRVVKDFHRLLQVLAHG